MQVQQIAIDVGMAGIKTKNQITSLTKDLEKLTNKVKDWYVRFQKRVHNQQILGVWGKFESREG